MCGFIQEVKTEEGTQIKEVEIIKDYFHEPEEHGVKFYDGKIYRKSECKFNDNSFLVEPPIKTNK